MKVSQTNVFDIPDDSRLLRIDFLITNLDFGAQKVNLLTFSQNLKFEPELFENDDFAPSNSKFSLLRRCLWSSYTWCEALSSILTFDLEPG